MASPGSQFVILQGEKQWDLLPLLISQEFQSRTEEINPVEDMRVTSVTNSEVEFDILTDTSYYTKGSYVFTLATSTLAKQ